MKKTYLSAGVAILFWSTIAVTTKLLLGDFSGMQILCISSLFASLFLLILNIINGKIKLLSVFKFKDYMMISLSGFCGTFLYHIFYYTGTDFLPASQAFVINYLWPIMSVVFACVILKEKFTFKKLLAVFISFVGVCIITGGSLLCFDKKAITGALMCILGAISYGIYTSLNKKYKYDEYIATMIHFFVTFLITAFLLIISNDIFLPNLSQSFGFLWNGIFTMAVATTAWMIAVNSGNTAKVSNLAYITPFLSLVWTTFILHEKFSASTFIGLIFIIAGIFIQIDKRKNP